MTNDAIQQEIKKDERIKKLGIYVIISLLVGLVGFYFGVNFSARSKNNVVDKVLDILENEWYSTVYYDEDNVDTQIAQFISSVSNFNYEKQLDPYTYFIKNTTISSSEPVAYMGVKIQKSFDYPMIRYVYENTPASKAGILMYDIILGVKKDDIWHYVDEEKENYSTITSYCSGKKGETITLKIRRFNNKHFQDLDINVTFDDIIYPYAYQQNINDRDSLMIKLESFSSDSLDRRSSVQIENIIKNNLDKKNLILDLRDNGGGSVDSMVEICDLFLPKNKLIMTTEIKDLTRTKYLTKDDTEYTFEQIIILMNNNTASASEILISCLDYHLDNVVLVGRKSYGKGIAQRKRVLTQEYSFQYTFAKWFTPADIWIQDESLQGISPSSDMDFIRYTNEYVTYYNLSNYYQLTHQKDYTFDMVDNNIKYFQEALNFIYPNLNLRVDGYFDNNTVEAIKDLQYDYNLEQTGIIDENTFLILSSLYINSLEVYFNVNHMNRVMELLGD